jgi:hypothetical protein
MIWHIVRKDLRLLWRLAVGVAAVNVFNAALLMSGGSFARAVGTESGQFGLVSNAVLPAIELVGLALLVIAAIQLDRLPGSSQDWLTRPIHRGDLFAAKLVFILVAGLAPIFLCDMALGLASRFDFSAVLAASLSRSVGLLCLICVPAALVAVVTATLSEALVFIVGLLVILIAELVAVIELNLFGAGLPAGFGWILLWILGLLNVVVLLLALPLQLRWRSSNRVRWLLLAVLSLEPLIAFIPASAVLRMQTAVEPGARASLSVDADRDRPVIFQDWGRRLPKPRELTNLSFPVVIAGTGQADHVHFDRAVLRFVLPDGAKPTEKLVAEYAAPMGPGLLSTDAESHRIAATASFSLPADVFVAAQALHATAELSLFGTDFRMDAQRSLKILRHEPLNDHTRCYERQRPRSESRVVDCESTQAIDDCWDLSTAVDGGAYQNVSAAACRRLDYAPWPVPVWRDAYYSGVVGQFQFNDSRTSGGATGVLDRSAADALVLTSFKPTGHFLGQLDFSLDGAIESSGANAKSRDGMGEAARFAAPAGIVIDRRGDLFIVDSEDSVIREVTPTGEVTTFAGLPQQTGSTDGSGPEARFSHPGGIAIDTSDDLFVVDSGNSTLRKITPTGIVSTVTVPGSAGAPPAPLHLRFPGAVAAGADGSLYVIVDSGKKLAGKRVTSGERSVIAIAPDGRVRTYAGPQALIDDPGP